MTRGLRAWGPPVLWAGLLFALSSRPTLPVDLETGFDKVVHFGAYAVLGLLLARARALTSIAPFWPLLLGVLFGLTDEIHQSFVPGRSAELGDWIADSLGVIAGTLFHSRLVEPSPR